MNSTKTWQFTLPTGAAATLPAGTYQVVIGTSAPAGYQSSQAFSAGDQSITESPAGSLGPGRRLYLTRNRLTSDT